MKHHRGPPATTPREEVDEVASRRGSRSLPDPVPILAMEAAVSIAMARVVQPFDRPAADAWMERAINRAEGAGELASAGSKTPELLRTSIDLVEAFARGQSLRRYADDSRELLKHGATTVWESGWRLGKGGGPATRTSVKQFADGYRPALEVSTYNGTGPPRLGPRRSELSEARDLAKLMESRFHRD